MATTLETLIVERAEYGERLSPAQANALLNVVAVQHPGLGLLRKDAGNNWAGCAVDILFDKVSGHHFDVLIDAPDTTVDPVYYGTCQPAWQDKGPMDLARWVPPLGTAPIPDPGTPPPVPGTDCADAHAAMVEQIGALTELANEFLKDAEELHAQVQASMARMDAIEARLADLAKPRVYTFSAGSGKTWGHSHPVTFTVEL